MDIVVRSRNFNLTDDQAVQVRSRVDRLSRHLDNLEYGEVLLTMEPTHFNSNHYQFVAQITLRTRSNNVIRSEVTNADLLAAVDDGATRLSRQIERFKGRFYHKKGKGSVRKPLPDASSFQTGPIYSESASDGSVADGGQAATFVTGPLSEDDLGDIVRTKRFAAKPMHPDEAIEQMELLGHNFYVFFNAAENNLNVLYRRTDGNYGLLQPELS